jgi:hypothetical protein
MRYFGLQVPGPNVDSYMRTFPDGTHLPGPRGAALDGRACGHVRAVPPEEKRLPLHSPPQLWHRRYRPIQSTEAQSCQKQPWMPPIP